MVQGLYIRMDLGQRIKLCVHRSHALNLVGYLICGAVLFVCVRAFTN